MEKIKTPKEEISQDIKKYSKIETVAKTEGGQELIIYLQGGISACVAELCSQYKKSELKDLISIIAEMNEKLNLLRTLTRAKKNKELAKEALEAEEKRLLELETS